MATMDMPEKLGEYVTIAVGSSALSTFLAHWFGRRKTRAEGEAILSDATMKFADGLQKQLDSLYGRLDAAQARHEHSHAELTDTRGKLDAAQQQIAQLQGILNAMKERDKKEKEVIRQVMDGLRVQDPSSPFLMALENLLH